MDVFEALYTTRAMRRVSEDPIPEDILKQMVDAGIRACLLYTSDAADE